MNDTSTNPQPPNPPSLSPAPPPPPIAFGPAAALPSPPPPKNPGAPGGLRSRAGPPPGPPTPPSLSPAPPPPPIAFGPAAALPSAPLPKNPGAAGVLGIIPGMGHLYLGLYQRAAILFGVWVLFISLADHSRGPFPGIAIPFWMVFSIIDATRQAKAINMTGRPEANVLGDRKSVV